MSHLGQAFSPLCWMYLFIFFPEERQRIESHLSNQSPFVEDNALIVNQVPFACPLLFYEDVHWAHSLLLYIIMTHHPCVLKHFNPNVCGC